MSSRSCFDVALKLIGSRGGAKQALQLCQTVDCCSLSSALLYELLVNQIKPSFKVNDRKMLQQQDSNKQQKVLLPAEQLVLSPLPPHEVRLSDSSLKMSLFHSSYTHLML